MSSTRVLKISVFSLGVLVVLVTLFLWLWDFSRYRPQLEAAISDTTGRKFAIDGNFELDVLPTPTVLIEKASLSNADWSEEPEMVEVGRAFLRVGLWSLLFRPVVVHELELSDVNIFLQVNSEGDANWDLFEKDGELDEAPEQAGSPAFPVDLRSAKLSSVNITYRRPEAEDIVVALESFAIATDDSDQKQLEAKAQWSDLPIEGKGTVAGRRTEIEATIGDVRFKSSTEKTNDSVNFNASVGSLADVGKLIEWEGMPVEDLSIAGNITLSGDTLVISNVLASLSGLRITMDGELDGNAGSLQLNVRAEGESLSFVDPDLPNIPFSTTAEISVADETVNVEPIAASFGESEFTGRLRRVGGNTPALHLEVQSPLIDLAPFASEEDSSDANANSADTGQKSESRYVFKDEALPLDALTKLNGDIDVSVKRLQTSATQINDLKVEGTVGDSVLNLKTAFTGQYGGRFENKLRLTTSNKSAELQVKVLAENLKLGTLSGTSVPEDQIPASNFDIDLKAVGITPRALASSADGKIVFTQGSGRVKNDLIEKLSGDIIASLFSALNPFAKHEEFTNWDCSIFAIDFESGLGNITGFLMQSDKLMIVGGGKVDLNSEDLDIEFNTKPRSGVGVSADMFVTPFVNVSGTLASPSVGLNKKGVLLSGGAAVLTGGMSFLYKGMVDRATAEGGQCVQALESVGKASTTLEAE